MLISLFAFDRCVLTVTWPKPASKPTRFFDSARLEEGGELRREVVAVGVLPGQLRDERLQRALELAAEGLEARSNRGRILGPKSDGVVVEFRPLESGRRTAAKKSL